MKKIVTPPAPPPPDAADPTVQLPDRLDLPAAVALTRTLLDLRGSAIVVDACGVRMLGTHGAQVLASAALTWAADQTGFRIAGASPEFCAAAEWLGLTTLLVPGDPS